MEDKGNNAVIEVTFKVRRFDATSGKLINEIDFNTKMTKADSGKCGCGDENMNVTIEPSGEDCPRLFINQYNKAPIKEEAKNK